MKKCRECQHEVSEKAYSCPHCGAPYPAREKWDGWGFEYKSSIVVFGIPLIHISFKYRPNKVPVVAKGIIAIGQFGVGFINISQIGVGFISLSQITVAVYALAQLAFAYACIAQIGLCIDRGYGQVIIKLTELLGR